MTPNLLCNSFHIGMDPNQNGVGFEKRGEVFGFEKFGFEKFGFEKFGFEKCGFEKF